MSDTNVVTKNIRSKLLSLLPENVDYQQWIDSASDTKSKNHFKVLLDTFYGSFLGHVKNGDFSNLEKLVKENGSFYAKYVIEGAGMAYGLLSKYGHSPDIDLDSSYFQRIDVNKLFSLGVGMSLVFLRQPFSGCSRFPGNLSQKELSDGFGFYSGIMLRKQLLDQSASFIDQGPSDTALWNGYGRALWFVSLSNPKKIASSVTAMPIRCRGAVWRGIGLAVGFTGGVEFDVSLRLAHLSEGNRVDLLQGVRDGLDLRKSEYEDYAYCRQANKLLLSSAEL